MGKRFSVLRRGGGIIAGALEGNEKLPARLGCGGGGCPAFALRSGCGWGVAHSRAPFGIRWGEYQPCCRRKLLRGTRSRATGTVALPVLKRC
jgi:hypothetical protein